MDREQLRLAFVNIAAVCNTQEIIGGLVDKALASGSQIAKVLRDRVCNEAAS